MTAANLPLLLTGIVFILGPVGLLGFLTAAERRADCSDS
jgi:hypothetical protein